MVALLRDLSFSLLAQWINIQAGDVWLTFYRCVCVKDLICLGMGIQASLQRIAVTADCSEAVAPPDFTSLAN